jgi:hypothetical protein
MPDFRDVDPRELCLPSAHGWGADPFKLQRQIAQFGKTTAGMPEILVREGSDGSLLIMDGITRAMRVAKLIPGTLVRVEVVSKSTRPFGRLPKIGEKLP